MSDAEPEAARVRERLPLLRAREGLSQYKLAAKVDALGGFPSSRRNGAKSSQTRGAIGKIESGVRGVSLDDAVVLARALDLSLSDLLADEGTSDQAHAPVVVPQEPRRGPSYPYQRRPRGAHRFAIELDLACADDIAPASLASSLTQLATAAMQGMVVAVRTVVLDGKVHEVPDDPPSPRAARARPVVDPRVRQAVMQLEGILSGLRVVVREGSGG